MELLGVVLIGVVIVVLVALIAAFLYMRRQRQRDEDQQTEDTSDETPPDPIDDRLQQSSKSPVTRPGTRADADTTGLIIAGTVSAVPDGIEGETESCYTGTSLRTNSHPFYLSSDCRLYVPHSSWWALSNTYGACLAPQARGSSLANAPRATMLFLTRSGLYLSSRGVVTKIGTGYNQQGQKIDSIVRYNNDVYGLCANKLWLLMTASTFFYHYPASTSNASQRREVSDLTPLSDNWEWYEMKLLLGRDISSHTITRLFVTAQQQRSDRLMLETRERDGLGMLVHDGRQWRYTTTSSSKTALETIVKTTSVTHYRYHDVHFEQGEVRVLSSTGRSREPLVTLNGVASVVVTYDDSDVPTVWHVDRRGVLWRSSKSTGYRRRQFSEGWSKLIPLEDGSVIVLSRSQMYSC